MAATLVEIVVSGPDPEGRWHWRLKDGSGGYSTAPADLVDPEWENGAVLLRPVQRTPGGHRLVAPVRSVEPEPAPLLLNGEPFEPPPDRDLEPGTVVIAGSGSPIAPVGRTQAPRPSVDPSPSSRSAQTR